MRKFSLYSCFLILCISHPLFSQSGSLDSTFGEFGLVATDIPGGNFDFLSAVLIQPDQKILAAGYGGSGAELDFIVIRYMPDGSFDQDFGDAGMARVDFNGGQDRCSDVALQPDGYIVLGGSTQINNETDFAVSRLTPDGQPDTTFGVQGKMITDLGSKYDYANGVGLQADGKIVLAGRMAVDFTSDFALVRYTAQGILDKDFGDGGIVTTNIQEEDEARDLVIQPDGKIILGGFASVSAKGDFAMVRYLQDGTLDKFFGDGGKVITDLEGTGRSDLSTAMGIDPDGKIVLTGFANYFNLTQEADLGMVRYHEDGSLDNSFGTGGIYILPLGSSTQINGITRQPDGKYLLCGQSDVIGLKNQWLLVRLLPEGALDTNFGNQGIVVTDLEGEGEVAFTLARQNDSRIVVGGWSGITSDRNFILARYIADFTMQILPVSEVTCYGGSDASFEVEVSGGVPPYVYSLDGTTFQASPLFNNLSAGNYTVVVMDSNGNGVTGEIGPITIDDAVEPPPVQVDVIENTIAISVDGTGSYSFSVDGGTSFQSGNIFSDLPDGTYLVIVRDENGCLIFSGVAVVQQTGIDKLEKSGFSIFPNPGKDQVTIKLDVADEKGVVRLVDMSGRCVFSREVFADSEGFVCLDVRNVCSGCYLLSIGQAQRWKSGFLSIIK